ncbi:MAG: hypothetical protein JWP37_2378, partial [Mucilaginibacter sp.]|nr:hypothetical protein [Mucilaginibacter sp.]
MRFKIVSRKAIFLQNCYFLNYLWQGFYESIN